MFEELFDRIHVAGDLEYSDGSGHRCDGFDVYLITHGANAEDGPYIELKRDGDAETFRITGRQLAAAFEAVTILDLEGRDDIAGPMFEAVAERIGRE